MKRQQIAFYVFNSLIVHLIERRRNAPQFGYEKSRFQFSQNVKFFSFVPQNMLGFEVSQKGIIDKLVTIVMWKIKVVSHFVSNYYIWSNETAPCIPPLKEKATKSKQYYNVIYK